MSRKQARENYEEIKDLKESNTICRKKGKYYERDKTGKGGGRIGPGLHMKRTTTHARTPSEPRKRQTIKLMSRRNMI